MAIRIRVPGVCFSFSFRHSFRYHPAPKESQGIHAPTEEVIRTSSAGTPRADKQRGQTTLRDRPLCAQLLQQLEPLERQRLPSVGAATPPTLESKATDTHTHPHTPTYPHAHTHTHTHTPTHPPTHPPPLPPTHPPTHTHFFARLATRHMRRPGKVQRCSWPNMPARDLMGEGKAKDCARGRSGATTPGAHRSVGSGWAPGVVAPILHAVAWAWSGLGSYSDL